MSDFKPSEGYATIEEEFEARTRKAFTTHPRADFVVIDSRHQRFQAEMTKYCQDKGWLDEGEFKDFPEGQWSEWRFRLTEAGKERFGLTSNV